MVESDDRSAGPFEPEDPLDPHGPWWHQGWDRAANRTYYSGGASRVYSGSGERDLETLQVLHSSTITWRMQGGQFSIENSSEEPHSIALSSSHAHGETSLGAGTYHEVTVKSDGPWSFTLAPG